jgi:hypothetical protein
MATIQPRKLSEKEVVLSYKDGPLVEQVVDGETKMVPGPQVPAVTVTMRELTCREAMDADDFITAEAKGGNPSLARMWKMYGIFSVVKITDERSPNGENVSPKSDEIEYKLFTDRITSAQADALGMQYRIFASELATRHDPKASPSDSQ